MTSKSGNDASRTDSMGTDNIGRLLFKFSVPAIIGMLVHAMYNVVDRIFIGQGVGSLAIAGLTIAWPVMLISLSLCMLVGHGATAVISIRLGEKKRAEAEKVLGNAFVLITVLFTILSVVGLVFLKPILILFGANETILPLSEAYLRIILFGFLFNGWGFLLNNTIRGEGKPKIAMITMLIGAVLNMILDPLFIFVFNWGIEGAAIATVISNFVSALWLFLYYLSGKSLLKIRVKNFRLSWKIVSSIVAIGFAPFAMQFVGSIISTLFNHQMMIYAGEVGVSVIGIIFSINMMVLMPAIGIAQGAQPIIGYNFGARDFSRVKAALRLAIIAASAISMAFFTLLILFTAPLVKLFNSNDIEFVTLGIKSVRTACVFLPLVGFQIVGSTYFQAVGKAGTSALLSISRQFIFLIPALLILPKFFGVSGVVGALPVSDLGAAIVTGAFVIKEMTKLEKKKGQV